MWKGTSPKKHKIGGGNGGEDGLVATMIVTALDNRGWQDGNGSGRTARAAADVNDLPGTSIIVGGGGDNDDDGRWGDADGQGTWAGAAANNDGIT